MQLKKKAAFGAALAAATSSLLGAARAQEPKIADVSPWELDGALLYYGESDSRVQDVSANVLATKTYRNDSSVSLRLAVDSLTGASPNGAAPASIAQTFTRPSGNDAYTVPAGELPLDDTFLDTRVAIDASWARPLGDLYRLNLGGSVSNEYDYTHLGVNAALARDFNQRNTTLQAGFAFGFEAIDPVGGAPAGLAEMLDVEDDTNKTGDEDKTVIDLLAGVTQVVNRRTLVQFNYSLTYADGYLSDPYKLLSVVDGLTGNPVPGSGDLDLYRYEHRPADRTKHSLYSLVKYSLDSGVLSASYRFMTDDWGIDSHTLDLRYRWNLTDRNAVEPHLRFYTQKAADFYAQYLVDGAPLPEFASADYRLAKFDAVTAGVKYTQRTRRDNEWSVRLEGYSQTGDSDPGAPGALRNLDLYPGLDAVIAQFSYRWRK